MKKLKKYRIIEIEWLDSMHEGGWQRESNIELTGKGLLHKTVGYFLKADKVSVIVFQSMGLPGESIDAIMEIPLCSVTKIRKLK